jgi:hypothetical protein
MPTSGIRPGGSPYFIFLAGSFFADYPRGPMKTLEKRCDVRPEGLHYYLVILYGFFITPQGLPRRSPNFLGIPQRISSTLSALPSRPLITSWRVFQDVLANSTWVFPVHFLMAAAFCLLRLKIIQ